ncbi:hypothetical protein [Streptomyces sp. NPDC004658]|uniref:hypothetical protein n=1 Tax=Streptomyces sp. NPDC004658 TaxID=3154672 RepID=UPI0033A601A1
MQDYPMYTVQADGANERGLTIQFRVELGAGGGLPGLASAEAVAQTLMDAAAAGGATAVSATRTDLSGSAIPRT